MPLLLCMTFLFLLLPMHHPQCTKLKKSERSYKVGRQPILYQEQEKAKLFFMFSHTPNHFFFPHSHAKGSKYIIFCVCVCPKSPTINLSSLGNTSVLWCHHSILCPLKIAFCKLTRLEICISSRNVCSVMTDHNLA